MAAQIAPGPAQRLQQTLAQWRHWQTDTALPCPPTLQRPLAGGRSNHSFLVGSGDRLFVVRIDRVSPAANGISRQAEWRALQVAARHGIAPTPRYFNPDLGALVCDYLPSQPGPAVKPAQLAGLLRTLHALPAIRWRMDPRERIRRYEHQLPGEWADLAKMAAPLLARLEATDPGELTLCHHDLGPDNLLQSDGSLVVLDWEYVAMGSRWFDIAVAARGQAMAGADLQSLLLHYLGREPSADEQRALEAQDLLSRYLELLWYASGQGGTLDAPGLRQQAAALEKRL